MSDLLFAVTQLGVQPGAQLQASHWHSGSCASCFHCALPRHCCPVTGVLQGSPGEHEDHTHPAGAGGWLKEAGWSRKSGGSDGAVPRGAVLQRQHDVCYRGWYPRVPTCTAAQLGLHVSARHSERRIWCLQSRVGHFSSGCEHLQAQRSWSELQLSQQLLPPEEWGRIHVVLRCHNAPIVAINTLHGASIHWAIFSLLFVWKLTPRTCMNVALTRCTAGYFCCP